MSAKAVEAGRAQESHIWRAFVEGASLLKEPSFIILTAAAAGMAIWVGRVYRGLPGK